MSRENKHEAWNCGEAVTEQHDHGSKASAKLKIHTDGKASTIQHDLSGKAFARDETAVEMAKLN